jgi:Zn-dependent protease with chaperone function
LQPWAWGGVECIPYIITRFFSKAEGSKIDTRIRLKILLVEASNHFFWSTTPLLFSVGVFLPIFFGGESFRQTQISINLSQFLSAFAQISLLFMIIFAFITITFIAKQGKDKLTVVDFLKIAAQSAFSPLIYMIMGVPALDSQIRGIQGKYLGYWVTPKK